MKNTRLLATLVFSLMCACLSFGSDIIPSIVSGTRSSTVVVKTQGPTDKSFVASGTGWLCIERNIIVTAKHVVVDDKGKTVACKVAFDDGKDITVDSVVVAPKADVAVLYLHENADKKHIALNFAAAPATYGECIYTVGHPYAQFMFQLSVGYITHEADEEGSFLVSVPIIPGNSGGAICNVKGEVTGMAVGYYKMTETISVGLALDVVRDEVKKITSKHKI